MAEFTEQEMADDVRVDVFRGAGVAVRATHLPTGVVRTVGAEETDGSEWLARQAALARLASAVGEL